MYKKGEPNLYIIHIIEERMHVRSLLVLLIFFLDEKKIRIQVKNVLKIKNDIIK